MPTERQARFGAAAPWHQTMAVKAEQYTCGYCDRLVASAAGYFTPGPPSRNARDCPNCHGLTVFGDNGATMPAPLPGQDVENLPEMVGKIYGEARAALAAGAPTAAALLFRTMLMHVACDLGAAPGKTFVEYVNFLEAGHHVPASGKAWLDHVRNQGNLATHKLVTIPDADARELLYWRSLTCCSASSSTSRPACLKGCRRRDTLARMAAKKRAKKGRAKKTKRQPLGVDEAEMKWAQGVFMKAIEAASGENDYVRQYHRRPALTDADWRENVNKQLDALGAWNGVSSLQHYIMRAAVGCYEYLYQQPQRHRAQDRRGGQ